MSVPRETLSTCPVCGHEQAQVFLQVTDHSASKERFDIVRCSGCGFRFTNPRPTEKEIGSYYKFADYISHTNKSGGLMGWVYRRVRARALKKKVALVKKWSRGNTLLDIGCGTGFFAAEATRSGFEVTGIEPDPDARQFAIEKNGINAISAEKMASINGPYAVISLWHVLEHLYHLKRDTEQINRLLASEGVLVVAVPNCDSADAKYYQEFWAGYDVPRHLYHFVEADLVKLFEPFGLKLQKVLPMPYDAYYVSMLSRQHQGKGKWGGLWQGWKSNRSARSGKTPWSSQIYIFTR